MGNDDLVKIVRNHRWYLEHHSPEFDRVLESMGKVDIVCNLIN